VNDTTPLDQVSLSLQNPRELAYGENRCQSPAHLLSTQSDDPLALSKFEWVSGIPSYISMADGFQIMDILRLLAESFRRWRGDVPYIVIAGKHGNPCGAAIDFESPLTAVNKALLGDTVAVMGGEIITNFPIDEKLAQALFQPSGDIHIGRKNWGLDLILAPGFSEGAVELLGKREKRRLLANSALQAAPFPTERWVYRQIGTDWLRQKAPTVVLEKSVILPWDGWSMSDTAFQNALVAFACCWRASSNTVSLAKDNMLIGLGCGQQDRIACVRLALDRANRAGHGTVGSIFASDAFFPYANSVSAWSGNDRTDLLIEMAGARDALQSPSHYVETIQRLANIAAQISRADRREGPELLIAAGCAGGVVPADGNKLEEVKDLFRSKDLAMAFLPPEFRGFSKH
jgi:phosphoribosylaminoimidazolecarboxamide formyltransferase/IMP cyclohydrolase